MQQRAFGQSGLSTTPIGLGLAALGRPGYINLGHGDDLGADKSKDSLKANAFVVLDAAWERGVRYFDTARSYGLGEQFLGKWLHRREIPRAEVLVGSKWGYTYTADWSVTLPHGVKHEVKSHTLPVLTRQIKESRHHLGQYLNLYQIHSATLESGVLTNRPVLDQLAEWRNHGLIIGFSVSGPQQDAVIDQALEISYDGLPLFGSVQVTWNLLEQRTTASLEAAHAAGLGVIVKEGLANGRLTNRNSDPSFAKQMALLQLAASTVDLSIDGLALGYISRQPFVDVVLSGAARIDHLYSNLSAAQFSNADLERVRPLLEGIIEEPVAYWQTRSRLAWN